MHHQPPPCRRGSTCNSNVVTFRNLDLDAGRNSANRIRSDFRFDQACDVKTGVVEIGASRHDGIGVKKADPDARVRFNPAPFTRNQVGVRPTDFGQRPQKPTRHERPPLNPYSDRPLPCPGCASGLRGEGGPKHAISRKLASLATHCAVLEYRSSEFANAHEEIEIS
jgi:hypothetical protein